MPAINKHDLDAELRSQLNFEFTPIYEGGLLSGVTPAPPFEDGVLMPGNVDSSIYVRFQATPYMASICDLWFYFTYYAGASTDDIDFDVYYQVYPVNDPVPGVVGPVPVSIIPDGTVNLQTTIDVINDNITAWRVPAAIKANSFVRFEIVRRGSTDTNNDDLKVMSVSYATIPTYQTLSQFDNGLAQPCVPFPTGTNILNNKGSLLTSDGINDIEYPVGTNGQVLTVNDAAPLGIEWAAPTGGGGGASLLAFSPAILTTDTVLTDTAVNFNHFVNNPSLVGSITITLPPAAGLDNGTPIAFYNLSVNPNGHKVNIVADAADSIFDNGGLAASIPMGNAAGETIILRTDGDDWYNLNTFPENPNAPFDLCYETPVFPGDSVTFTLSSSALPPFYMFVNNILYSSPTHFVVTGANNTTWTWQNVLFPLIASDEIRLIYNCGGLGSGTQATEQFIAAPAQTLFSLTQDAQPPFFFYVNGNAYLTPTSFTVGGAGNRDWTWLDVDFALAGGEEILLQFFVP